MEKDVAAAHLAEQKVFGGMVEETWVIPRYKIGTPEE